MLYTTKSKKESNKSPKCPSGFELLLYQNNEEEIGSLREGRCKGIFFSDSGERFEFIETNVSLLLSILPLSLFYIPIAHSIFIVVQGSYPNFASNIF